jgi:hypothetical protein
MAKYVVHMGVTVKCIRNVNKKIRLEDTNLNTWSWMGGSYYNKD